MSNLTAPPTERKTEKAKGERRGLVIINTGHGKGKTTAALGLMTVLFGVGQALGPYLAGVLADSTRSFAPAFAIAGTIARLLGAGGSLMLRTSTNPTGVDR